MRFTVAGAPGHATEGVVLERLVGDGVFEAAEGPFRTYRRDGDRVEFRLAVPFFAWIFVLPVRHELRKQLLGRSSGMPWWGALRPKRGSARMSSLSTVPVPSIFHPW